ncbi:peptide chain release factor N(5)-glutamine methyltransferase [Ruminococcus sp. AF18-22]|nr:peptide chain release factor N(5)-glutamine methyltransferase [Ruminococcus sp. AF18-22]
MKSGEESLQDAYSWGRGELESAKIQEYELDAWYLLEYVTGIDRARYYVEPAQKISEEQKQTYRSLINRRKKRVPLQHLTGEQAFMGLKFKVNEQVLIPRQDTEIAVETALELLKNGKVPSDEEEIKILDMCTGSGCILLSVLYWAKEHARKDKKGRKIAGIGADISERALEVARENAENLNILAEFISGDLFENITGKFEMIISNPPYIRTSEIENLEPEVKEHDPIEALDGKTDGLYFYREIVRISGDFLEKEGVLLFEIGCDQGKEVAMLLQENGFMDVTVKKDLAGLDRVVYGVYDR